MARGQDTRFDPRRQIPGPETYKEQREENDAYDESQAFYDDWYQQQRERNV
jgi:hypothetical protein